MQVGEAIIVSRCGTGGRILGVCSGPGESSITCTSLHGVQIVDLPSGECTSNWAVKGGVIPSLPAAVSSFSSHSERNMRQRNLGSMCHVQYDSFNPVDPIVCVFLFFKVVGTGKRIIMACDDGSVLGWSVSDTDMNKAKSLKKV
jgi:hypothetical protein